MKPDFVKEIYLLVMLLGGKSDILSTIGSIGSTLSDEEALSLIKEYNQYTLKEQTEYIDSCIKYSRG